MPTEQTLPLHQLIHSDANVRRTGRTDGIAELAASIAAHGLRQNLNVTPTDNPERFAVVAGARRLRALKLLAKTGRLAKDAPIACLVLDESDDPAEISLAENAIRLAMHPDDQCDAFRALIEEKQLSPEDVAARFGTTAAVVRQRLKLANVSPKLRARFRKGEIGLEHMMALALVDDHAAQEKAWKNLPEWNRQPATLKRLLTGEALPADHKLARFVGIEAYEAAGGAVLRDLFDEDGTYLTDRALVERLATDRLHHAMEEVQAEGWKWVLPEMTPDYRVSYRRVYPVQEGDGARRFAPEDMARAGARLTIDHDGNLEIERGLVHPDDAKAEARQATPRHPATPGELSAAMVEDLSAHRTAALRIELARNPAVALAAMVHALALPLVYGEPSACCLTIRASSEPLERHTRAPGDSPAHQALKDEAERWGDLLPGDPADLLGWCLAQPQDSLLDLLAFVAALTVDAVRLRHTDARAAAMADPLAEALALDMRQWWTPSIEGFYQRLPKTALAHAVIEAKAAPLGVSLTAVPKAEAARLASKALTGTGWLPAPLLPAPAVAA